MGFFGFIKFIINRVDVEFRVELILDIMVVINLVNISLVSFGGVNLVIK